MTRHARRSKKWPFTASAINLPLSPINGRGMIALVDLADAPSAAEWKWHYLLPRTTSKTARTWLSIISKSRNATSDC